MNVTPENITGLKPNEIFVFGSNLAGIHGAGAARLAYEKFGATRLQGVGMSGQSYALPTKDYRLETLNLKAIEYHIDDLISFALGHPELHFLVTAVGTGLAGLKPEHIAPMFGPVDRIPPNVSLPQSFWDVLNTSHGQA